MQAISNRIEIGDDPNNLLFEFENDSIKSVTSETAVSLIGDELYIDQFTPVVEYTLYVGSLFRPRMTSSVALTYSGMQTADSGNPFFYTYGNADLRTIPYGTKVTHYVDDVLDSVFYVKSVERIGKNSYKINGMSAIGLIDQQVSRGGIYTGQYFPDVLAEIIGEAAEGAKYNYAVDEELENVRVYGWLPHSTRRRNLHQLLVAYGVNIIRKDDGNMLFTFLENSYIPVSYASGVAATIPKDRIFAGGSVTYNEPASKVEVVEHGFHYLPFIEEETLFDNSGDDTVENALVVFDKPIYVGSIHQTEGSNLTISSQAIGVNYAYVTGTGTLVGRPYVHTTSVVSQENENAYSERIVSVDEATLVTMANSENVLLRLSEYYMNATEVKNDIILEDEKCGRLYNLWNAFQENLKGFLTRMSVRNSSFRRAQCEFIQNYLPVGIGATYTESVLIPMVNGDSESWTIPDSVFSKATPNVRVVLIGYGEDGADGEDGEDGGTANEHGGGEGGKGGAGGARGLGGQVYVKTYKFEDDTITALNFSCSNGVISMSAGTSISISSALGVSSEYGFYDEFSGVVHALPGHEGRSGAAGGKGGIVNHIDYAPSWNDFTYTEPERGENAEWRGTTYYGGGIIPVYDVSAELAKVENNQTLTPEEQARFDRWDAIINDAPGNDYALAFPPASQDDIWVVPEIMNPHHRTDEAAKTKRWLEADYDYDELGISEALLNVICGRGGGGGAAIGGNGKDGVGKLLAYSSWSAAQKPKTGGWAAVTGCDKGGDGGDGANGEAILPKAVGINLVTESGGVYSGFTVCTNRYVNPTSGNLTRSSNSSLSVLVFAVEGGKQYTAYKDPLSTMRVACGDASAATIDASTSSISTTGFAVSADKSNDPLTISIPSGSSYLYVQLGAYANVDAGMSNAEFYPSLQVYESQTIYGFGGNGGNGGGGAGGSGAQVWANNYSHGINGVLSGDKGHGGKGGAGSKGAPGCVIIYY